MAAASRSKTSTPDSLRFHLVIYLFCLLAGVFAGWVLWAKPPKSWRAQPATTTTMATLTSNPKIVLPAHTDPNMLPKAPAGQAGITASQAKCFQALAVIDPDWRFAEFMAALQQMQPGDAPGVFKKLKEEFRPEKTPNREWEAFLHRWGEIAPADSVAYAMQRDTPSSQGYFLKYFLEGWARVDCPAAAQWLNEQPNVPEWGGAFAGLVRGMASKDPWGATKTALASMPEDLGWLRDNLAAYLAAAVMRQGGADELQKWFATLPTQTKVELEFKKKAMLSTTQHLDTQDSKNARQWLLAQPAAPWRSEAAYHLVAMKWSKEDPAAALTWLSELARGEAPLRPAAGRDIFQEWGVKKPGEAEQWARSVNNVPFMQFVASGKEPTKQPGKQPPKKTPQGPQRQ